MTSLAKPTIISLMYNPHFLHEVHFVEVGFFLLMHEEITTHVIKQVTSSPEQSELRYSHTTT